MGEALITRRGGAGGGAVLMTEQVLTFSCYHDDLSPDYYLTTSNPTRTITEYLKVDNSNNLRADRLQPIEGFVELAASIPISYKTVATGVGSSTALAFCCPFRLGEEIVTERKGYDNSGKLIHVRAKASIEQADALWQLTVVCERVDDTTSTGSIRVGAVKYMALTAIGLF